jgi:hypothetical protein
MWVIVELIQAIDYLVGSW